MFGLRQCLALFFVCFGLAAQASDHVSPSGKMSDEAFYRLVACGAPPGKACRNTFIRWQKKTVKVALVDIESTLSKSMAVTAIQSLESAVAEINSVGASIKLVFSSKEDADIKVYVAANTRVNGHPMVSAISAHLGPSNGVARVFFERGEISHAIVVVAGGTKPSKVRSVMLEEIVQSLGLMTDIRSRYYRSRSIFSEHASIVTQLHGQDAEALRTHYPKPN